LAVVLWVLVLVLVLIVTMYGQQKTPRAGGH
jgi:hypothetical protein